MAGKSQLWYGVVVGGGGAGVGVAEGAALVVGGGGNWPGMRMPGERAGARPGGAACWVPGAAVL